MNYVSTRDTAVKVSASQAITKGISSEGGLFVPENLPKVSMSEIEKIAGYDYIGIWLVGGHAA